MCDHVADDSGEDCSYVAPEDLVRYPADTARDGCLQTNLELGFDGEDTFGQGRKAALEYRAEADFDRGDVKRRHGRYDEELRAGGNVGIAGIQVESGSSRIGEVRLDLAPEDSSRNRGGSRRLHESRGSVVAEQPKSAAKLERLGVRVPISARDRFRPGEDDAILRHGKRGNLLFLDRIAAAVVEEHDGVVGG